jgi:hypothetical protein
MIKRELEKDEKIVIFKNLDILESFLHKIKGNGVIAYSEYWKRLNEKAKDLSMTAEYMLEEE